VVVKILICDFSDFGEFWGCRLAYSAGSLIKYVMYRNRYSEVNIGKDGNTDNRIDIALGSNRDN